MDDLIKALQIFNKDTTKKYQTACGFEVFYVFVNPVLLSIEEIRELYDLGFYADYDNEKFYSYKYGSY